MIRYLIKIALLLVHASMNLISSSAWSREDHADVVGVSAVQPSLGTIVPFDVNTVQLTDESKAVIDILLPELDGKQHRLEVRGHSASNGSSSPQATIDAWNISYQRSLAVMQYLVDQGIDPRRIRLSQAGNSEPRYKAEEVDHSNDSRVEVFVLTELFEEPSSQTERLISTKKLDKEAIALDKKDKAAAAAAGEAAPKKH